MDVSGTQMVTPIQKPDEQLLALRINQRISAEVVQIAGEQVTLSMDGMKIVARLTSADQSAALADQKRASFIVKDTSGPLVTLQLVRPAVMGHAPVNLPASELAQRLLVGLGIPVNAQTVAIARSLVGHGLAVTPEAVQEFQQALQGLSRWGEQEVNLAAWIKTQGLPISPGSLSLALSYHNGPTMTETMVALKTRLNSFVVGQGAETTKELAQQLIQVLSDLLMRFDASPEQIRETLQHITRLFGGSIEKGLAGQILGETSLKAHEPNQETPLDLLVRMRSEAVKQGDQQLVNQIDRFIETVRWLQFTNVEPQDVLDRGQWISFKLPTEVNSQADRDLAGYREASLRISCRSESGKVKADPGYTRLVIEMDMKHDQTLSVDLSIVQKLVGATITTSSPDLQILAEEDIEQFQASIEALGFVLKNASCTVGELPSKPSPAPKTMLNLPGKPVDLDA